jgi:hypothetical protein
MAKKRVVTNECCSLNIPQCNTGSAIYGLGFIGALIYYISTATTFWIGALGVLKAITWPALLIYEVLKYISA